MISIKEKASGSISFSHYVVLRPMGTNFSNVTVVNNVCRKYVAWLKIERMSNVPEVY